ncbi:endonuclease domain-containing 1 protein-like isoform X2 [Fundulus heteroclitus]|nr:endonuclease domain-containing 1 protein-like isoform X2 [Fundulus heteroclitus]
MTSQQVWSFLPVAALLLLLSVHTLAEVVESMSDCSQFFLDQTPPHVPGILEDGEILNQNRYKPICQTYENQRRFVTLYDTKNKIPLFSAFRFVGEVDKKRPENLWKIEPQLENEAADKNMQLDDNNKEYNHQAGDIDYRSNERFDRGHIFPSSYASTNDDKISTFTLTNIVPQAKSFNQGSWKNMEQCVKCVMEEYCINSNGDIEGFVVTGAQPSSGSFLNNRVNVPSALWSAFCCYSANKKAWLASAHWGDNVQDESKNKFLDTITLEALYQKLNMSNSGFLFSGKNCPLQTTVTKFYPEIDKICSCPPTIPESSPTSSGSFVLLIIFLSSTLFYILITGHRAEQD